MGGTTSDVVVLGGGQGAAQVAQAALSLKPHKGPVPVLSANLSQSGRSSALQNIVRRDWDKWKSYLGQALRVLPRWVQGKLDWVAVETVPYMGFPMQALEAGIENPWLASLLATEVTDYDGSPSDWIRRMGIQPEIDENQRRLIALIEKRVNSIPPSIQALIRSDTVRRETGMVPRAHPLRNLLFLGALYESGVVVAPGVVRRSAYLRCMTRLAKDLNSTVLPLTVGFETAWDITMVASDAQGREVVGENSLALRSEIGPINKVTLRGGPHRDSRPLADPSALRALRQARQIIIGPANLSTLVGVLAPQGVVEALTAARQQGAQIVWLFNPVQNQDTEGLTPLGLVDVLERSLSSPSRPVRLKDFVTDVFLNSPDRDAQSLIGSKAAPEDADTDPEKARRQAEHISGLWQGQTVALQQVELEHYLGARVFALPLAEVTDEGYELDPAQLLSLLAVMRQYRATGRLVGVFDKDDTLTKANTVIPEPMAQAIVRALWAGLIFAPHTASSFEELVKHLNPLFPLPRYIQGNQLPLIASILDARLFDRLSETYQPALTDDFFQTVSRRFEEKVHEKGGDLAATRHALRANGLALLKTVHRHWPGNEKEVLAVIALLENQNISVRDLKLSLLTKAREDLKNIIESHPSPPTWMMSLATALARPRVTSRDALALFIEVERVRFALAPVSPQEVVRRISEDLILIDEQLPSLAAPLIGGFVQAVGEDSDFLKNMEEKAEIFDWPSKLKEGLNNDNLPTYQLVALWVESLLANERAREHNYGSRVERRMAPPGQTAVGIPRDLQEIWGYRRVQYVLRGIPTKQAQRAASERVTKIIQEAGLPIEAVPAGTSSVNFYPEGQSKKDALALLAYLFNLSVRDFIFADDKPHIGEVRPAVEAVGTFINAGSSPMAYPLHHTTVIHSKKPGPEAVRNFIELAAGYLEGVNVGTIVRMSDLPPPWESLMGRLVDERLLEHLLRGSGPFESMGGDRLARRAHAVEEAVYNRTQLESLIGKAELLKKEGVRYVICVGTGGMGSLASLVDRLPSAGETCRLFPLDDVDPSEFKRVKSSLVDAEASRWEKLKMRWDPAVEDAVWNRACKKSALVVLAKGWREEGQEEIQILTGLIGTLFGQVDAEKKFNDVFVFAEPPQGEDDRAAIEWNWAKSIGAQRIPLQFDRSRDLLKRYLHPGLPFAFLLALKGHSPSKVLKAIGAYGHRGVAEDGFVRLAAWLEGYFQQGKKHVVLVLPSGLEALGPLTSRSVEPGWISPDGRSPQMAYGLPLDVNAYPDSSHASTVFVHVRLEGGEDENAIAVADLRFAGHPVAEVILPDDPAVAFGVWMEGLFRMSSMMGVLGQRSLTSTPQVPAYDMALASLRYVEGETVFPQKYKDLGVRIQGVFVPGGVSSQEVDALLSRSGIHQPNGADFYAACLYLLQKQSQAGESAIAEIRYLGSPSPRLQGSIKEGQKIMSILLKKIVRFGFRMSVDYRGSLARPFQGTSVLLETLVHPTLSSGSEGGESNDPSPIARFARGEILQHHQRAIIQAFTDEHVPHAVLNLPENEAEAAKQLKQFFVSVRHRFQHFENFDQPNRSRPVAKETDVARIKILVGIGIVVFVLGWALIFGPSSVPAEMAWLGMSTPIFTGRSEDPAPMGKDPMNFRSLPKHEVLEVLKKDLGERFPAGEEEKSIRVIWPHWYGTDEREKAYPVPEIRITLPTGQEARYFVKPSNFFPVTEIGLHVQRLLGMDSVRAWPVSGWYVVGDAGLDCPTVLSLLTTLWQETQRREDSQARDVLGAYMAQLNVEIGKTLATEVLLGYIDGVGKNVMIRNTPELRSILKNEVSDGFEQAIQWLRDHPPEMGLFDFEPRQFLNAFHFEHYWEPGGVDYMMRYAKDAFDGLFRLGREMEILNEDQVKMGFLDQMNKGLEAEDNVVDYLEKAVPPAHASRYFEDGFVEYFQKRLEDDPDEWFHTLLADTVFYDYQPTWPVAAKGDKKALKKLQNRLATKEVLRTANIFDLDGDPQILQRALHWVREGSVDEVIVHGDVFDRGADNKGCYLALRELDSILGDRLTLLFGNHEIMMIEALILKKREALPVWLANGGTEVLREFGVLEMGERVARKIGNLETLPELAAHSHGGFRWALFVRLVRHAFQRASGYGVHQVVDYDYEQFLNDHKMKPLIEMAWWVLNRSRFHIVDDKGWLHVHAGMPLTIDKKPLFSALDLEEAEGRMRVILQRAKAPYDLDVNRRNALMRLFHKYSGVFWARKSYWIYRLFNPHKAKRSYYPPHVSPEQEASLRKRARILATVAGGGDEDMHFKNLVKNTLKSDQVFFVTELDDLALRWMKSVLTRISPTVFGIMIGHNRVDYVHNVENMFYCADLGRPTAILSGPEGIQFVGEKDTPSNPGSLQTFLTNAEMAARVTEAIGRSGKETPPPISLPYLVTGDWRWGLLGVFAEWMVGVLVSSHLTTLVLGIWGGSVALVPLLAASGVFAGGLLFYSHVHAMIAQKKGFQGETMDFFVEFLPYLVLPVFQVLFPGATALSAAGVLVYHLGVDLRSQMGKEMVGSASPVAHRLLSLMPDARQGTYSVNDLERTVSTPSLPLLPVAQKIVRGASVAQKEEMSTSLGALNVLCGNLGINRRAVALIPLSAELLANDRLTSLAHGALKIHGQAVFYVEEGFEIPPKMTSLLQDSQGKGLVRVLPSGVKLFDQGRLMMDIIETYSPEGVPDVQPYLPAGYQANVQKVQDQGRFGMNAIRSLSLLAHFERLWELARIIAQQA